MEVVRPEFEPDPALSREEMEHLQEDIAGAATFADDLPFDPGAVRITGVVDDDSDVVTVDGDPDEPAVGVDANVSESDAGRQTTFGDEEPLVAGVDQAFLDEQAVSAVVVLRDGEVVERAHAVTDLEIPYIPGLLAFREGRPILAALETLESDPDLLVVDGSGRIHFRQAGIATHVGVMLDCPAVGVAKNLLCGEPERPLTGKLPRGERVPILAAGRLDAPAGTVVGHAYQSRQYESPDRHVNPLYVSPGHRVGADTATDLVSQCCAGYKLPEPTRLADRHADAVKRELEGE